MPERVGLVGRGAQALHPMAAPDTVAQITEEVQRPQVVTLKVGARRRELRYRRHHIDHGELIVRGVDRCRAARPLVDLATRGRDPGPIGIARKCLDWPLAVPAAAPPPPLPRPPPPRPAPPDGRVTPSPT